MAKQRKIRTDVGGTIRTKGSSREYKTGPWRTKRPVRDASKCINCLACFNYCPENIWKSKGGKIQKVDLEYCKGCGICAEVCPVKCIKMVPECEIGNEPKAQSPKPKARKKK